MKKKICLFICLFMHIVLPLFGIKKKSASDVDIGSLQPESLQEGVVKIVLIHKDGSVIGGASIEDPRGVFLRFRNNEDIPVIKGRLAHLSNSAQKALIKHFKEKIQEKKWQRNPEDRCQDYQYWVISPTQFHEENFVIRAVKTVVNNPVVIKILVEAVPPELIKLLPHYSFQNKREKEINEELMLQKKRHKEALEELKNQRESLKKTSKYFQQIALHQRYIQKK